MKFLIKFTVLLHGGFLRYLGFMIYTPHYRLITRPTANGDEFDKICPARTSLKLSSQLNFWSAETILSIFQGFKKYFLWISKNLRHNIFNNIVKYDKYKYYKQIFGITLMTILLLFTENFKQ